MTVSEWFFGISFLCFYGKLFYDKSRAFYEGLLCLAVLLVVWRWFFDGIGPAGWVLGMGLLWAWKRLRSPAKFDEMPDWLAEWDDEPQPEPPVAAAPAEWAQIPALQARRPGQRSLDEEAWCWYHLTSETFYQGAIDACQAVAVLHGGMDQTWGEHVRALQRGIEAVRKAGDYEPLAKAAEAIMGTREEAEGLWMGWLGDREGQYAWLSAVAGNYACEIAQTLKAGLLGGEYWLGQAQHDIPERRNWPLGPAGADITSIFAGMEEFDYRHVGLEENYPHFRRYPVPKVFPDYVPQVDRAIKTGETVPWTGVWIPAAGLERHNLTFAIAGRPMQPVWRIVQTREENKRALLEQEGWREDGIGLVYDPHGAQMTPLPQYEITEMVWYPLLPADAPEAKTAGRVPAGQPCPIRGWWSTPAQKNSRALFERDAILPAIADAAPDAAFWQWDRNQERK
ncbi:MAG: hypothetical protein LBR05_07495 [Azoarcus sp.]|jgi:hypothetical protein|nr:hypothetical protein [Azoarcus sp.]